MTTKIENHENDLKNRKTCKSPLGLYPKGSKQRFISAGDVQASPFQVSSTQRDGQTHKAEQKTAGSASGTPQEQQGQKVADHAPRIRQVKVYQVPKAPGHEKNMNLPHFEVQKLVHSIVKELWEMYDLGEGPKVLSGLPTPCPSDLFLQSMTYGQHLNMRTRHRYSKVRK